MMISSDSLNVLILKKPLLNDNPFIQGDFNNSYTAGFMEMVPSVYTLLLNSIPSITQYRVTEETVFRKHMVAHMQLYIHWQYGIKGRKCFKSYL